MSTKTTNLLRRTFVSLGAALALAAGTQAVAQTATVTLTGSTSATCQYSEMKVTPNGNITVTCGGAASTTVATFSLSHASASNSPAYSLAPNTSSSVTLSRTGGPTDALMVTFGVSGTGCSLNSGGIMLLAGQSQTIPFSVGAAGTA